MLRKKRRPWHCSQTQVVISDFSQIANVTLAETTVMSGAGELLSVDYEVFGRVQGVFFRKYTQAEGKKLGLVGWVKNTDAGTVQGQLQGPNNKVKQMQEWLKSTGSPKSQIIKAEFKNEKIVKNLDHTTFEIVH